MKTKFNKMKKILYITFGFLIITSSIYAQKMNRQKIQLLKTAYITDAIDLTPKEAEKFWPIYNQYTEQLQNLKFKLEGNLRKELKLSGGWKTITEDAAKEILDQSLVLEKEVSETKSKLIQELSKIISAKKIVGLQMAEKDFNRKILQEFGRRRNGQ